MLNKFLYYFIVFPISKLPLEIIYLLFKPIYFITYFIIGYRKSVVRNNIQNSFPNKTTLQHKIIERQFFKYLAELLAESIKNLSFKKKELQKRCSVINPELLDNLYKENKDVIIISSHFNNWEWLITIQNLIFKHQAIGIGMPLSNSFWDNKINSRRERFGMKVVNSKNYKSVNQELINKNTATLILGDQSPSKIENIYWTQFLNQTTPFYFGAEIIANQKNVAVVYASLNNIKKGKYQINLSLITKTPREEKYGFITEKYVSLLENDILKKPSRWLWSHKRWKIEIPYNIKEQKKDHKTRFQLKFRSENSFK